MSTDARRIPAAERRELVLQTATEEFARRGYAGTTTDQIAKAAGISQPYVVRMFGTKEQLFIDVLDRALSFLCGEFRAAIARHAAAGAPRETLPRELGRAYVALTSDGCVLNAIMQGNMLGDTALIGPVARAGFLEVYRILRDEAGLTPQEAHSFLADGMLISTLLALRMPQSGDADDLTDELLQGAFGPHRDIAAGDR